MTIYSSAFDPRHYRDDNANNVAFLEFIVGLIFGSPIRVAAGSLFDCLPLHNVWRSFYRSFLNYPELYIDHGIRPLMIVIDQERHPYASEDNIAFKIAHDYLSGKGVAEGGEVSLDSENFEFYIAKPGEISNLMQAPKFGGLRSGRIDALESLQNGLFVESLRELNDYCNRFKPYEFVKYENRLDILQFYMKGCIGLARLLPESRPDIAGELTEGVRTIATTPMAYRMSTASLIKTAREKFPNTFDPVVVPLSRALSSQLKANSMGVKMATNYEMNSIKDKIVFEAAWQVVAQHRVKTLNEDRPGKQIKLSSTSFKGKLATVFDWDAFHNVIFHPECIARIQAIKSAENEIEKHSLIEGHAHAISKELIDILALRVESTDANSINVAVDLTHKEPVAFKVATKLIDKLIDYVPMDVGNDVLLRWVRTKAMREGLCAINARSGGL